MAPFFGEGGVGPLAEPRLLAAPTQPLVAQDLPDPAALDADPPLLSQVCREAVQRPTGKRQIQRLGIGQAGGDHLADLLLGVRRRSPGPASIPEPVQPVRVEARQPQPHRSRAHTHLARDGGHAPALAGQRDDAGALDGTRWRGAGAGQADDRPLLRLRQRAQA